MRRSITLVPLILGAVLARAQSGPGDLAQLTAAVLKLAPSAFVLDAWCDKTTGAVVDPADPRQSAPEPCTLVLARSEVDRRLLAGRLGREHGGRRIRYDILIGRATTVSAVSVAQLLESSVLVDGASVRVEGDQEVVLEAQTKGEARVLREMYAEGTLQGIKITVRSAEGDDRPTDVGRVGFLAQCGERLTRFFGRLRRR